MSSFTSRGREGRSVRRRMGLGAESGESDRRFRFGDAYMFVLGGESGAFDSIL